ncbi:sortase [Streptomyces sp. NPDC050636]|uniref:sortase domain-containing protein n=1 Tax=Streptomyces sp. NPDC050636 TaxID=3154510 RepID=UPI00344883F4
MSAEEEGRAEASGPAGGHRPGHGHHRPRHGQLLIGVAWAVLLLGLWLWGRGMTDGGAAKVPTTGDVAAVGRPWGQVLPHAHAHATASGQASPHAHHAPLGRASPRAHHAVAASSSARPSRITIDVLGVRAGIVERGPDESGEALPSPPGSPDLVGWYADGPQPGAEGVAVLVGQAGGDTRRAVFHGLAGAKPGDRVDVRRADGSTARFTVEDVRLHDREHFDASQVYAAHAPGRSELRLVTRGGSFDPARRAYTAHVVVSAYLTGFQGAHAGNAADG